MESISNFISSIPNVFSPTQQQQRSDNFIIIEENTTGNNVTIMNDIDSPITGICLVAKPSNVPTGYQCIRKAFDDPARDADLMPDTFLDRKNRFLCTTQIYPLAGNQQFALEDIKILNERESPPTSYLPLSTTVDTYEKGTAKKMIYVKMIERQAGMKCICDIIFLYRARRPPQWYRLVGEINGFQMCVKENVVPAVRKVTPINTSQAQSNLYPNPMTFQGGSDAQHYHAVGDHQSTSSHLKKSDEKELLEGIPFEINSKYLKSKKQNDRKSNSDSFQILSTYEIEKLFDYDFTIERSLFN